jgi:hypothetical protein
MTVTVAVYQGMNELESSDFPLLENEELSKLSVALLESTIPLLKTGGGTRHQ